MKGKPSHDPFSSTIEKTISRLNELAGTSYQPQTNATRNHINARLREGFTDADLIVVVEDRCARWREDPKMREYLRPSTLFNSEKFEGYLEAARANGAKPMTDAERQEWRKGTFVNV